MAGRKNRIAAFRSGDRSEYLAVYGLSRFCYVYPFARQEDFGVADVLCVLTREQEGAIHPDLAFYVQVKANRRADPFGRAAIRWISTHMAHPLFICVADKKRETLSLYDLTPAIESLVLCPGATEVKVAINGASATSNVAPTKPGGTKYVIETGPPILAKKLSELEAAGNNAYDIMLPWITDGAANLARRRLGHVVTTRFRQWQTNVAPSIEDRFGRYYFGDAGFSDAAHKELALLLTALAHNYRHNRLTEKLKAARGLLVHLREHLDEHGRQFADGVMVVDPEPA